MHGLSDICVFARAWETSDSYLHDIPYCAWVTCLWGSCSVELTRGAPLGPSWQKCHIAVKVQAQPQKGAAAECVVKHQDTLNLLAWREKQRRKWELWQHFAFVLFERQISTKTWHPWVWKHTIASLYIHKVMVRGGKNSCFRKQQVWFKKIKRSWLWFSLTLHAWCFLSSSCQCLPSN